MFPMIVMACSVPLVTALMQPKYANLLWFYLMPGSNNLNAFVVSSLVYYHIQIKVK